MHINKFCFETLSFVNVLEHSWNSIKFAIYFLHICIHFFFLFSLKKYDAIIVRSDTKITSDVLSSGSQGRLKVVGRAGVGIDNIDVEAATNNDVVVLK